MKNKLRSLIVILLLHSILVMSCGSQNGIPHGSQISENFYKMSDIPDGFYVLSQNDTAIYPYDDRIYAANSESGSIGYYNPASGMEYTKIAEYPADNIWSDGENIIFLYDNVVTMMDMDGNIVSEWKIDLPEEQIDRSELCGSKDRIFVILRTSAENADEQTFAVTIDRTGENVTTTELTGDYHLYSLMSVNHEKENSFILLATYRYANGNTLYPGVFRYDTDTAVLEYLYDFEGETNADYADGKVYSFTDSMTVLQLAETSNQGENVNILRNIGYDTFYRQFNSAIGTENENMHYTSLYCTGYDYIIWNGRKHVMAVYSLGTSSDGQTLNVIYPINEMTNDGIEKAYVGDAEYDMMWFEEHENCVIKAQMYPVTEYADRLRMKLLAGEEDMDIIYATNCEEGDLLSAILRYQLYLPLENYSPITENFSAFADGVREYMTHEGHLIGVPYQFGTQGFIVTEEYKDLGLPVPETDWTLDDFFAICEEAAEFCDEDTALSPLPQNWIMKALIQESYEKGSIDYEQIYNVTAKIYHYYNRGVFASYRNAETFLLNDRVNIPAQSWTHYSSEYFSTVVPTPTIAGKRYAALSSFTFIYAKSMNVDLAVKYLTMLSGEDFAAKIDDGKTYFMKASDSYFYLIWGDGWTGQYEKFTWNKETEELRGDNGKLVELTSEIFPGTSIQTIDDAETDIKLDEIFGQLFADTITVEEAAEAIVSFVKYRYFE